jgi:uncharacterized tellurite resistance protein B-like protein
MFFRRKVQEPEATSGVAELQKAVRACLPGGDEDTFRMVTALAGLLASIAYADRSLSAEEEAHARQALGTVHGLSADGVEAIVRVVREHVQSIATINPQAFTRELRDGCDVEVRREVLDVLVDLAAADGSVSHDEVNLLRRTTAALGLSPDDYVVSQARYRERLSRIR